MQEIGTVDFYNGSIELDYAELYTTFHCTLLVYRGSESGEYRFVNDVTDVLSVWWEFETASERGIEYNDFSWVLFYEYLKGYFSESAL